MKLLPLDVRSFRIFGIVPLRFWAKILGINFEFSFAKTFISAKLYRLHSVRNLLQWASLTLIL